MPVSCATTALTGQSGSIWFTPAGTSFCLEDFTDFPAGTNITVPTDNDYRVGDTVIFSEAEGGQLDSALTASVLATDTYTIYYVVAVAVDGTSVDVSATAGGTAITLQGDGGTGTANSPAPAHIEIGYYPYGAVCAVREFSLSIEREELDVTTLPCGVGGTTAGAKYAAFRKTQSGYASGSGDMTIYFTDDQSTLANRLLGNVVLRSQNGAAVKLYVDTVAGTTTEAGVLQPDDSKSLYVEADISLTSMSLSVNPDDATTADVSYTITNPRHILGATVG
jgi:hypothetical protein